MRIKVTLILLFISTAVAAQKAPLTEQEMEQAEVEPLELEPLTVTDIPWTLEQETTLRIVRQALGQTRSDRREDIDEWVCWFEQNTGSSFTYLKCARNGDLWALRPNAAGGSIMDALPQGEAGYGKILVSTRPANKWKIMRALEQMPGSAEFDEEFIQMAALGKRPPQDVPGDDELDSFARAWQAVQALEQRGAPEQEQIGAITGAGLSLKRYNRIATLVDEYQSIENQVAARLGR